MNSIDARGGQYASSRRMSHLGRLPPQQQQQSEGSESSVTSEGSLNKDLQTLETLLTIDDQISQRPGASSGVESTSGSVALKGTGLEFQDLTYTVIAKQKRDWEWVTREVNLLNSITGQAARGQVTAVMGPSGAGKSTFLDALAGRIASGSLEGEVTVDGHPVNPSLMKRISAYVMQEDQLFPMLTVYETFLFAAEVRLPCTVSRREKKVRVEELIDQLGLTSARNTFIGDEGHRGVSGGERRRVSIGVDIIHGPSLLFLDEPTSGLDSSSAYSVVEKVHDIATAGSTILMTIHQPSSRIQQLLNRLIILARGKLIYQGSPDYLKKHMQALGRPVPRGENSIEYLLDVIQEYDRSTMGLDPLVQFNKDGRKPMATVLIPKGTSTPNKVWPMPTKAPNLRDSPIRSSPKFLKQQDKDEENAIPEEAPGTPLRSDHAYDYHTEDDDEDYDRSLIRGNMYLGTTQPKLLASSYYRPVDAGGFPLRTPLYLLRTPGRTPGRTPTRTPMTPMTKTPTHFMRYPKTPQTPGKGPGKMMRGSGIDAKSMYKQDTTEIAPDTPATPRTPGTPPTDYETDPDYEMIGHGQGLGEGRKFANPWLREVAVLIVRNFYNIYRTPELFLSRQMVLTVMGFMLATLFYKTSVDLKEVTHLLSFIIFTVCLFFFSSNDAVPAFIQERFIFIRETSHNAYRASSYTIAGVITFLPFLAIQALTYTIITWWALKLDGSILFFALVLYVSLLTTSSFVMFISALVPNFILGYAAVIACTALFFLTCGYFLPRTQIPPYWTWLHYLSTIKYPYEALLLNEFDSGKCWAVKGLPEASCPLTGKALLKGLAVGEQFGKGMAVLVLLGWAVFYRILFYLVLRFNSKNQRH